MSNHFWYFDRLVEDGAPRRSGDPGIFPFLRAFWGFLGLCNGYGMSAHGFLPMFRPFCKCINKYLGDVIRGASRGLCAPYVGSVGLVQETIRGFMLRLCKALC
jgi:hypothetical protein